MGRRERAEDAEDRRTPEQAFGFPLRKIRRKRGLSQQRLADKSDYHRTYIGLLERGQESPSLHAIFNIGLFRRNGEEGRLRQSEHPGTPSGTKAARGRLLGY
jgi:transcriptional regulator with XRE-family HTH domain